MFKALIWTFTALAFPFVPFRLFVRWKVFRKLFADDGFVVLTYCLLLTYAIIWQDRAHDLYVVFDVASGFIKADATFIDHFERFLTTEMVSYPSCLWLIKFSFLLFFRRLDRHVKYQKIVWWSAFVLTVVCLEIWWGMSHWQCIAASSAVALATCDGQKSIDYSQIVLKLQTAVNIISDAFSRFNSVFKFRSQLTNLPVMTISMSLLWNVQISLRKKLKLIDIFSMIVFVMIADIIRAIVSDSVALIDLSWCYAWFAIKMSVDKSYFSLYRIDINPCHDCWSTNGHSDYDCLCRLISSSLYH